MSLYKIHWLPLLCCFGFIVSLAQTALAQGDRSLKARADYIARASKQLAGSTAEDIDRVEQSLKFLLATSCRASALELKVQCLLQKLPNYCQSWQPRQRSRCSVIADVLSQITLARSEFLSNRERYRMVQSGGQASTASRMYQLLWQRYAELSIAFRLSTDASCSASQQPCFAESVDRFCRHRSDLGLLSWQSCVSPLLLISSTAGQQWLTAKQPTRTADSSDPVPAESPENLTGDSSEEVSAADSGQKSDLTVEQDIPSMALFSIDLSASHPSLNWLATSFKVVSASLLAEFKKLEYRTGSDQLVADCGDDLACRMSRLYSDGISIYITGELRDEGIELKVFDTRRARLHATSFFAFERVDDGELTKYKIYLYDLLRDFTRQGGLIDRWTAAERLLGSDFELEKNWIMSRINLLISKSYESDKPDTLISQILLNLVFLVHGILWALFLVSLWQQFFPRVDRLQDVPQKLLASVLKSFLLMSLLRIGWIFLVFSPAIGLIVTCIYTTELSVVSVWLLIAPWLLLINDLLWRLNLARLARKRDRQHQQHTHLSAELVQKAISIYLHQYFARNQVPMPHPLLRSIGFYASNQVGMESYSSGFGRFHIAIEEDLLGRVFGDLQKPETLPQNDESLSIMPVEFVEDPNAELPEPDPEQEELAQASSKRLKSRFMSLETFKRLRSFKQFEVDAPNQDGLGVVDPDPKIPETPEDREQDVDPDFIRNLEKEQPEFADFFYGLLMAEFGKIDSRQALFFNLQVGVVEQLTRRDKPWFAFGQRLVDFVRRNFGRFGCLLQHGYVASHQATAHLIQSLHVDLTDQKELLTQGADRSMLREQAYQILQQYEFSQVAGDDIYRNQATRRNRLFWLANYVQSTPLAPQKKGRTVRILFIAAWAGVVLLILGLVYQSYQYSPIYQQRMVEFQQKLEQDMGP